MLVLLEMFDLLSDDIVLDFKENRSAENGSRVLSSVKIWWTPTTESSLTAGAFDMRSTRWPHFWHKIDIILFCWHVPDHSQEDPGHSPLQTDRGPRQLRPGPQWVLLRQVRRERWLWWWWRYSGTRWSSPRYWTIIAQVRRMETKLDNRQLNNLIS